MVALLSLVTAGVSFIYIGIFYGMHLCFTAWEREGETPYCKQCGYNLSDLVVDRCPECDHNYVSFGFHRGGKHFLPRRFALGLLLSVGGTAGLLWPVIQEF